MMWHRFREVVQRHVLVLKNGACNKIPETIFVFNIVFVYEYLISSGVIFSNWGFTGREHLHFRGDLYNKRLSETALRIGNSDGSSRRFDTRHGNWTTLQLEAEVVTHQKIQQNRFFTTEHWRFNTRNQMSHLSHCLSRCWGRQSVCENMESNEDYQNIDYFYSRPTREIKRPPVELKPGKHQQYNL